jgi:beta-phosphoglucomutase-like phosphatase (HAD superfamily)
MAQKRAHFHAHPRAMKMNKSAAHPSYQQRPMFAPDARCGTAMCEKCMELDRKIEHYRELTQSRTDQPTIDGLKELIRDLHEQKIALHAGPAEPKE